MSENTGLKINIIFKSGKEIVVTCDKMTWRVNGYGRIVSYEIINVKPNLSYCCPEEIAAIITH